MNFSTRCKHGKCFIFKTLPTFLLLCFFSLQTFAILDIQVSAAAKPEKPGIFNYTQIEIVIQNLGDVLATNIVMEVPLHPALAFVSQEASHGQYDSWTGYWTIASLSPEAYDTLRVQLYTLSSDPIPMKATLKSVQPRDLNLGNNVGRVTLNDAGGNNNLPDLIISSMAAPGFANSGDTLSVQTLIKNIGQSPAGSTKLSFHLSTDPSLSPDDIFLGNTDVDALLVDQVSIKRFDLPIPESVPTGSYFLLARADSKDFLLEKNEANNLLAANLSLQGRTQQIQGTDLELKLTASNGMPPIFNHVSLYLELTNHGTSNASGIQVGFQVPLQQLAFTNQSEPGGTNYNFWNGTWSVPALGAQQSMVLQLDLYTLTEDPVNLFAQVIASAQPENDSSPNNNNTGIPQEDDETLLILNRIVSADDPDLVVGIIDVEPVISPGDYLTFDIKARNLGASDAGAHKLAYYLSKDENISTDDILLEKQNIQGIPSMGYVAINRALQIPAYLTSGTYYLIFKADADNAITEINEGNNQNSKAFLITTRNGINHEIDLELNLTADQDEYELFHYLTFYLQVQNLGPDEATSVGIDFKMPPGTAFDNKSASIGEYNQYDGRWSIDLLPAGERATLELRLYTIADGMPIQGFAQVVIASQIDEDSHPNNNTTGQPAEDDEALFIVQPKGISPRVSVKGLELGNQNFEVHNVYPNPAVDQVYISYFSELETLQYDVVDATGRIHLSSSLQQAKGFHQFSLDVNQLPAGMYAVLIHNGGKVVPIRFFRAIR